LNPLLMNHMIISQTITGDVQYCVCLVVV